MALFSFSLSSSDLGGSAQEMRCRIVYMLARGRVNIPARVVGVLVGIETDILHLLQIDRHMQIGLIYWIRSGRPLQDSPFFEVNMDWMDPIARKDVVPQGPFLHCAFQDHVVHPVRVERQTIDMELPAI